MPNPRCPKCGGKSQSIPGDLFRCHKCGGYHDGNPSEGGTHATGDPSRRLEREEQRQQKAARVRRGPR